MRRREFITLIGGAAAWPVVTRAQEPGRIYRLGLMIPAPKAAPHIVSFFDELRGLGFVDGQNLKIDSGNFGLRDEQLPETAAAMAKSPPEIIFCSTASGIRAVRSVIRDVPLVGLSSDMVADGIVKSIAHPDGDITGMSLLNPDLDGKRQDILIDAVPGARRMAMLVDPAMNAPAHHKALQDAARARGVEFVIFTARRSEEIAPAMSQAKESGGAGIIFVASPLWSSNRDIVIERANALRLPAIFEWPEMAEQGGLIGYGSHLSLTFRQLARMVAKVLRGAKPADMPVEQPTQFELVINLQAARAIGHEVPAGLALRADKLIE